VRDQTDALLRTAAIGVAAGMRSQLPLALLSLAARRDRGRLNLPNTLSSPIVATFLLAAAAGEFLVDKLPVTPSRLMPGSLVVRAGIGGLAGALLVRRSGLPPAAGATLGAVGALVGSYAGHDVRAGLVAATGLPDPLFAVLEDVTAVAIGAYAVELIGQPGREDATRSR